MEKSRMHAVKAGKGTRMNFSEAKQVLEMPNLIEVQKNSYDWFLKEGLREAFDDISPITNMGTGRRKVEIESPEPGADGSVDSENRTGYSGNANSLRLEFVDYTLCRDEIKYTIEECKERDATYAAPLKVRVRLTNLEKDEINEHDIFMGDLPLMTDTGSFVINGAERVIVSQLVRSPGIYYGCTHDTRGKELYTCQVIPNRGAWLEYETDSNNVFWVRVDRTRKVPVSVLIRALMDPASGYHGTDADIYSIFGEERKLVDTIAKESASYTDKDKEKAPHGSYVSGLLELYKKIRPGEPLSVDSASSLLNSMFFDARRYDLAKVGRYKFNKKLNFMFRLEGKILAEDVVDMNTGEVIAEAGTTCDRVLGARIQNTGIAAVLVNGKPVGENGEARAVRVLSNRMVDIHEYVPFDLEEAQPTELVYYPVLMDLIKEVGLKDKKAFKLAVKKSMSELVPKHITVDDIYASINYALHLEEGVGTVDDIDHLGNRRIRAVGELLQNQYRIGLSRMERVVKERMSTQDIDEITPQSLINIKPVTAAVKEFFGSSQLSQFMDQNNPLSEMTHKRRLSALGPGGLSRDRAGFEVRDVHYTHYGRMCPIETPEGPNIGLINSLASYARINEYGFIEAPYRIIDKSNPEDPRVTDEIVYLTADREDDYHVVQASEPLTDDGHFVNRNVSGRFRDSTEAFPRTRADLMDVSPKMLLSVATSMIPFLENDDPTRALMGSNMQRQAVPLMRTEAAVIGTGIDDKVAKDSGVCVVAQEDGVVTEVDATHIVVKPAKGGEHLYRLTKYMRSNQSNCYNQKPIVNVGDQVRAGDIIADGPSTSQGELALGKNPLIGFMTWEGYNYEDAVLLSERLVQDDVYTSIHIEEYECEARDTKLGPEEITKDVPGVGDDALKDLDERGIIRIGAEVRAGDILVGKVTPKGETELTPEERLLRAIFGEKAREVRDTSLKVPHGAYGTIVDAKVFTRENSDELSPGVSESVRIYIAQKRKIGVGDKMAGRHGNKGVVSRVLPVEDMPYLPNGRPLDIVLNPLGVPSRMNIGQVLELHLSLAAKALGFDIATPIFEGANEADIQNCLEMANDYVNGTREYAKDADDTDYNENAWKDFQKKYKDVLKPDVMKYLGEHLEHRELWKGVPISRDGKVRLRDGRTGEYFDSPVSIGHMHYLKLHHLVDDKIHARSTGPYSLVTQQPLGGKAQFGGQRFGEMEVWALEAYGASYTLQEILTMKSDDVVGRVKTYEAIIKGENIPKPGIPESFKVLIKELQSLALDVRVLKDDGTEVELKENVDDADISFRKLLEGGSFRDNGYGSAYKQSEEDRKNELKDLMGADLYDEEGNKVPSGKFGEEVEWNEDKGTYVGVESGNEYAAEKDDEDLIDSAESEADDFDRDFDSEKDN